jgi:hypothetical protein
LIDTEFPKKTVDVGQAPHQDRMGFTDVMRHCISLNGSFFNTQRMVQQYVMKAYLE